MSDKENMIPNEPEVELEAEAPKTKKVEYDESLFENSTIFGTAAHQKKKRKFTPMVRGFIISGISLAVAGHSIRFWPCCNHSRICSILSKSVDSSICSGLP